MPDPLKSNQENTPPLFRSRKDDPKTSRDAAKKANEQSAQTRKSQILHQMTFHPDGVTSFTVAEVLDVPPQDISSLFTELDRQGLIYRTGASQMGPKGSRRLLFWMTPPEGKPPEAIEAARRGGHQEQVSGIEHSWIDGGGCSGILITTKQGVFCSECQSKFQILHHHTFENGVMMLKGGARALAAYSGRLAADLNNAAKAMEGIE